MHLIHMSLEYCEENGCVQLAKAFKLGFPNVAYHTYSAKRKVLKMPVAALRVGSGKSEVYLSKGVNYQQLLCLLNAFHLAANTKLELESTIGLIQLRRG